MYRPFTLSRTICTLLTAVAFGVSLTPVRAQSDDVARAIYISGRVSVLRGGELAHSTGPAGAKDQDRLQGEDRHRELRLPGIHRGLRGGSQGAGGLARTHAPGSGSW